MKLSLISSLRFPLMLPQFLFLMSRIEMGQISAHEKTQFKCANNLLRISHPHLNWVESRGWVRSAPTCCLLVFPQRVQTGQQPVHFLNVSPKQTHNKAQTKPLRAYGNALLSCVCEAGSKQRRRVCVRNDLAMDDRKDQWGKDNGND